MKTIDQLLEQFTSRTIVDQMADLFREKDKEFFDDEVRMLKAVATLKKELPADFSPSVDECIRAYELDMLTRIVYAGYNFLLLNLGIKKGTPSGVPKIIM